MGKKAYIIQSLGYEYDDETYSRPESGGGNPQLVLMDEVMAKKKMMELEIESWRGGRIGYYGYGIDSIASDEEAFEKALNEMGFDINDWYNIEIPKDASDDQIKKLIKASSLRFNEIVEVDFEDIITQNTHDEIGPSEEMLGIQDELTKNLKPGIFGEVDDFMSPDVRPIVDPTTGQIDLKYNPMNIDEDYYLTTRADSSKESGSIESIKEAIKETEDDFISIKNEMKRLRDDARSKVKNFFIRGMNKIFEMYPEVKTVSWTQYTPYFNDGEPCEFRCHSSDFSVNGYDEYEEDEDNELEDVFADGAVGDYEYVRDENGSRRVYKNPGAKSVRIYRAIEDFLSQLDDDDYKTMFGDHAKVIVKKDEAIIEEYDHE